MGATLLIIISPEIALSISHYVSLRYALLSFNRVSVSLYCIWKKLMSQCRDVPASAPSITPVALVRAMNSRDAFLRAAAKATEKDQTELSTLIEALDSALRAWDLAFEVERRLSVAANSKGNAQVVCGKLTAELAWLDWARKEIRRQNDVVQKMSAGTTTSGSQAMVRRVATECATAEAELDAQGIMVWRALAAVEQGTWLTATSEPLRATVQRLKGEVRLAECDLGYARDANAAPATLAECQRAAITKLTALANAEAALQALPSPPSHALRFMPQWGSSVPADRVGAVAAPAAAGAGVGVQPHRIK